MGQTDRQTDGQTPDRYTDPTRSVNNHMGIILCAGTIRAVIYFTYLLRMKQQKQIQTNTVNLIHYHSLLIEIQHIQPTRQKIEKALKQ